MNSLAGDRRDAVEQILAKRRLRHLCRRGTKELGLITSAYLDNYYASANPSEKRLFYQLLIMDDMELYDWLGSIPIMPGLSADQRLDHAIRHLLEGRV